MLSLIFNHPAYLLFILEFILIIGVIGKSLINIKRIFGLLIILFLFSTILWTLFFSGETLIWKCWIISIYLEPFLYGMGIGIKLSIMIISITLFISCTRIEEFDFGLNRLKLPFKINFALTNAFRLVPAFINVSQTIIQAQRIKGLDLEKDGLIQKAQGYVSLIVPIITHTIRKTNLLLQALESKGFGDTEKKSLYFNFRMQTIDYCIIALIFFLNLFALCIRLSGFGGV